MSNRWNILYRGPLSSCNYECNYCPFAKTSNTAAEIKADEQCLLRFVDWVEEQTDREIGILITPWGEGMIHPSYQRAMTRLSHLPNVYRISIQTNLSGRLDWLEHVDKKTLALWTTFHPTQSSVENYLTKCHQLDALGIRYSVGTVGLREHQTDISLLREKLNPDVYLWVNAFKGVADYYKEGEIDYFTRLDPHFPTNTKRHPSLGKPCVAGHSSFSVDGDGSAFRCHFIKEPIGNIYHPDFRTSLSPQPAPCSNDTCGCHIGYVHMPELKADKLYQDGLLERIPHAYSKS